MTSASILGCQGLELSKEERAFFSEVKPWGFILFRRNIGDPEQVKDLVEALRDTVGRFDAPILIDQEGGRVQRLGPPHWMVYPHGRAYREAAARTGSDARDLVRLGARLIAHDLYELGINVDCVPVLDVPQANADAIIGDRAYGVTADEVSRLGRAACEGLIAGGVLPVIKHIPGHGRAQCDSHLALPIVEASLSELAEVDFAPFAANSDAPMAMTAHVVFKALDRKRPVTTSKKAIELIRSGLGFQGLLMSDDLSMKALSGGFSERAHDSIKAGCDVVLHCNGDMKEMKAVVRGAGTLTGKARRRADAVLLRLPRTPEPFDVDAGRARFRAVFDL